MGRLTLPASGVIYADAPVSIYTADVHPVYAPLLIPLWQAVTNAAVQVVSSELTLVETLVLPLRTSNSLMLRQREGIWQQQNAQLLPVTETVLREAARLRATHSGLKTPDAIHAATALIHGCVLFISNDQGFRRIPGLSLVLLDEVLAAP
jgi:predicted nucleic acid-binding protein